MHSSNDELVRHYHGCTVVSVPDTSRELPEGSDGWLHAVMVGNVTVDGPFVSLARAITAAREVPDELKAARSAEGSADVAAEPYQSADGELSVNPA